MVPLYSCTFKLPVLLSYFLGKYRYLASLFYLLREKKNEIQKGCQPLVFQKLDANLLFDDFIGFMQCLKMLTLLYDLYVEVYK